MRLDDGGTAESERRCDVIIQPTIYFNSDLKYAYR